MKENPWNSENSKSPLAQIKRAEVGLEANTEQIKEVIETREGWINNLLVLDAQFPLDKIKDEKLEAELRALRNKWLSKIDQLAILENDIRENREVFTASKNGLS